MRIADSGQQELDETEYWLLIIERTGMMKASKLIPLREETVELLRIFTSSSKAAKRRR